MNFMLMIASKLSKKPQIDRKSYKDLDFRSLKILVIFPILFHYNCFCFVGHILGTNFCDPRHIRLRLHGTG